MQNVQKIQAAATFDFLLFTFYFITGTAKTNSIPQWYRCKEYRAMGFLLYSRTKQRRMEKDTGAQLLGTAGLWKLQLRQRLQDQW